LHPIYLFAGLIHEDVRIDPFNDHVDPQEILLGFGFTAVYGFPFTRIEVFVLSFGISFSLQKGKVFRSPSQGFPDVFSPNIRFFEARIRVSLMHSH
jgi:hypothetical protein